MAKPKYYLGRMGNLYHSSGIPFLLKNYEDTRNVPAAKAKDQNKSAPILRLRPGIGKGKEQELQTAPRVEIRGECSKVTPPVPDSSDCASSDATTTYQKGTLPDGPWTRHPDEIDEDYKWSEEDVRDDITIEENRERYKEQMNKLLSEAKAGIDGVKEIICVMTAPQAVDMTDIEGFDEELVDLMVERWFVNAPIYAQPGVAMGPPSMRDRYHRDWSWNARGVYYRHYYSPEWVTGDHSLWVPNLDNTDWNDQAEQARRLRARTLLKHALDNHQWKKSEYAWEADAWADVFDQMRDDPIVAADKREFCTVRSAAHPVSCLQMDQSNSRFIRRIPDITFGLATFQPDKHYQNDVASCDLDAECLQALALHRNCGLLADPRWGDSNLVFPFAVYEAKGWTGEPREARLQACSAAAAYLDLLDALARQPGFEGKQDGDYQTVESRSSQVFAMTSFGAHWHVMVGYRRPRLAREYAKRTGMSDTVYLFQRIWSGRISTERKAWELLSIVDQIHNWGVTAHRDFVIRHLKPWHEFCKRCYIHDVGCMHSRLDHSVPWDGRILDVGLAAWTQYLSDEARSKLQKTADKLFRKAYLKYRPETRRKGGSLKSPFACVHETCGPFPGYPISSLEDLLRHYQIYHEVEIDDQCCRQLYEENFGEQDEKADREQGVKKAEEGQGGEGTEDRIATDLSRARGGQKRAQRACEDDGDPGPSSRKKIRL